MPTNEVLEKLETLIKFIFSWVILMPIALIVSGKFIAQPIPLKVNSKQLFKISLGMLVVEATDDEVIYGFTGFIITFLLVAIIGGKDAYALVKNNFGVDAGQFNSLCILSSFSTVLWSFLLFILWKLFSNVTNGDKRQLKERDDLIEEIAKKDRRSNNGH